MRGEGASAGVLAPFVIGGHRVGALSLFNFNGHDVRVVMIDGAPWWVAADVCRALGIHVYGGKANVTEATKKLYGDEVQFYRIELTAGRPRNHAVISESGLYKLVMRSDKPEARAFQNWVTREVLPAIRKDGSYVMGEEKVRTGEMAQGNVMCGVSAGRVISSDCNSYGEAS